MPGTGRARSGQGGRYVGSGAVRYRDVIEAAGGVVPPDDDELHLPRARFHAALARDRGPAELVEPVYVRAPDAKHGARADRDPAPPAARPDRDRGDRARAYPTPWSRSMFAGELSKPSSICLGAFEDGGACSAT